MNNTGSAQGSQGSGQLLKADDVLKLQSINDDAKTKYRLIVQNMWTMMEKVTPDSNEYRTARIKLTEFSSKLITQERMFRQKQAQQAGARPQGQPGQQSQQGQPVQGQQRQPLQNQPSQGQPATNPQGHPPQQISASIVQHVQNFDYQVPPGTPARGTPEGDKMVKELRNAYLMALNKQEKSKNRVNGLIQLMEQCKSRGQDIPQEVMNQKNAAEQEYNAADTYVKDFRNKQVRWKAQVDQQQRQQQPQQQQGFPQIKIEGQIKTEGGGAPQGQQFNNVQVGGQQGQQPSQAQGPSIAAIEAARNQVSARNSQNQQNPATSQQQPPQPGQAPATFTPSSQQPGGASTQIGQQPNAMNAPRPQINQQQQQQQNAHQLPQQQQQNSPHPQSATQANNPSGLPVPLSHQAAVSAAQRSYSNPDPQRTVTPQQIPTNQGGSYHSIGNREQLNNPKMPIPKTLNVAPPQAVSMGPARPTMGGPGNGAPGMMGQPVINKLPAFQLEGEGDRILSKRKLDELVRQVTGGGEGPGGESLTPEVEEAMLQLADDFVDTVISSACKLSKLRESPQLDIRDIQLVLERNYNIRIPGYASDEIRTVRKLHPAPGWTQKMNAVQAAKVMGGKTDI